MSSSPHRSESVSGVKSRLIESGGRMAQDFGFNRVAGQVLACLYMTDGAASLDVLEGELQLSKAAVSLACTQLERLGLIHRVRRAGDRKRYYRSADDIGSALRHGILTLMRSKMVVLETDLRQAASSLSGMPDDVGADFLAGRVARMQDLDRRLGRLLDNPLLKLLSKLG